jgi:hypothetical protein
MSFDRPGRLSGDSLLQSIKLSRAKAPMPFGLDVT